MSKRCVSSLENEKWKKKTKILSDGRKKEYMQYVYVLCIIYIFHIFIIYYTYFIYCIYFMIRALIFGLNVLMFGV